MRDELGNQKQWRSVDVRFGSLADITACSRRMSALPPIADIQRMGWHVRFVPLADITEMQSSAQKRREANSPAVAASVSARDNSPTLGLASIHHSPVFWTGGH